MLFEGVDDSKEGWRGLCFAVSDNPLCDVAVWSNSIPVEIVGRVGLSDHDMRRTCPRITKVSYREACCSPFVGLAILILITNHKHVEWNRTDQ